MSQMLRAWIWHINGPKVKEYLKTSKVYDTKFTVQ